MRKKASGFYADSLEMLLDTMCNVLGAIVFITLALAVLAPSSPAPVRAELQRQVTELSNAVAAVTASNAVVQAEVGQTVLRLQEPHQNFQTNRMRLPNIGPATRPPWNVIVRYGRLFPVNLLSSTARGKIDRNLQTIDWPGGVPKPKWDQGDEPEGGITQMAQAFRRTSQTNFQLVFWVYEDSFPAFNRARETAVSLHLQYGWKPVAHDEPLHIGGRGGGRIPPQN